MSETNDELNLSWRPDTTVWAFNKPDTPEQVKRIYEEVKKGKSRFGWSWDDKHNLNMENNWTDQHNRQLFLLEIKKNDWIVHINVPEWGMCVAAQVIKEYGFDGGFAAENETGKDFRHFFEIDTKSIVEFKRNNRAIDPRVNLKPRYRYHRVYAVKEFIRSMEDLVSGKEIRDNREQHHLWKETDELLNRIVPIIQQMHKGKKLEGFLAEVFRKIPGVTVNENGSGWGTDHGADLIVTVKVPVGESVNFEYKIVVQVKSLVGQVGEGKGNEAVDQIEEAIKEFAADAGMIVTTGERTEILEAAISRVSKERECPVELLAGKEVAEFVIKNAPDLVFPFNHK